MMRRWRIAIDNVVLDHVGIPAEAPPTAAAAARIRAARLSDTPSLATRLYALPAPLVWNVLTCWACARDPDY